MRCFSLDALRFTPQSRLRVFLVGSKRHFGHTTPELILARPKSLLSDRLKQSLIANKDLRWFYNDIPIPPPLNSTGLNKIIEPMEETDSRWWAADEVDRHLAMMDTTHSERVLRLKSNQCFSYRTFYRRRREGKQRAEVRNDDLSGCLRTAVGGSGKQFVIRAGKGEVKMRTMTPREYARLQGVPDKYSITVNGIQALTGFGDAVCVPAISWIAQNILNPLAENRSQIYHQQISSAQYFLFDHERQSKP